MSWKPMRYLARSILRTRWLVLLLGGLLIIIYLITQRFSRLEELTLTRFGSDEEHQARNGRLNLGGYDFQEAR